MMTTKFPHFLIKSHFSLKKIIKMIDLFYANFLPSPFVIFFYPQMSISKANKFHATTARSYVLSTVDHILRKGFDNCK